MNLAKKLNRKTEKEKKNPAKPYYNIMMNQSNVMIVR